MRGQDIHRLRTRDAGHELHRQCFEACSGISIDACTLTEGIERGGNPCAGIDPAKQIDFRSLHAQHDVSALGGAAFDDLGPRRAVGLIRDRCTGPCASFNADSRP